MQHCERSTPPPIPTKTPQIIKPILGFHKNNPNDLHNSGNACVFNNKCMFVFNVYMPCDVNTNDDLYEFNTILSDILY